MLRRMIKGESQWYFVFIFALILRLAAAFVVWHPDVRNHMDWGERFFEYGAGGFYSPEANVWDYTWPNQPPGTIYMFAGIRKLYECLFAFFWGVNVRVAAFPSDVMFFLEDNLYPALLKLPSIAADFGIAYLIYKALADMGKRELGRYGALAFLINPAVWYNSAVWGQTDAVVNFIMMASIYLLLRQKIMPSVALLFLSLYIKLSLVIFIPLYGLVMVKRKIGVKRAVYGVLLGAVLIGVLTLPFSYNPVSFLYWVYRKKVLTEQLQVITANAFNLWAALAGIHEQPHIKTFIIFSYKVWGNVLYAAAYLLILIKVGRAKGEKSFWMGFAAVSFAAFILMTNMHERYLYPFFPFFTIVAARNKKFRGWYWAISLISVLNLYNFWWVPKFQPLVLFLSFGDRIMPRVFGGIMTAVFLKLLYGFVRERKLV